jgi:GNAT superfamily N-acetyltransferase
MLKKNKIFKNIEFWIKINHFERIKIYGFFKHIKYVFNFNVSEIIINFQLDLSKLPSLNPPAGYSVRELDIKSKEDILSWIMIINQSYSDANEDYNTFNKLLHRHTFLDVEKIFFLTTENKPVGTITVGRYKKNRSIGGGARLGVLPSEQGKGLGFFLQNYAFTYLKSKGILIGETVVTLKRTRSIFLSFRCGFIPVFDRSKITFDTQKRMWPARLIAKWRVRQLYRNYIISIK